MTIKEFDEWYEKNCVARKKYYCNNIEYELVTMKDGWIGIIEVDGSYYIPRIEARDMAHAKSWCAFTEKINVPIQKIC